MRSQEVEQKNEKMGTLIVAEAHPAVAQLDTNFAQVY